MIAPIMVSIMDKTTNKIRYQDYLFFAIGNIELPGEDDLHIFL